MENVANAMVLAVSAVAALVVVLTTWLDPIPPQPQEEGRPIIVACGEDIEELLGSGHVVIQEGCDEPTQQPQPTVAMTVEASE